MADRDFVDAPVRVPEKASLFEDFIDIFTAPSKVYARRADGHFWLILLILTVLFAVLAFAGRAAFQALMEAEFQRNSADMMQQNPNMTEEQLAQMRRFGMMGGMVAMYVAMPVMILLVSIVVWVLGKIFGAALSYGQAAVIVCYAQIPRLLGSILFLVQGLLIDPATAGGFAAYSIGPARFMDPQTTSAGVIALLGRLDLLNVIWPTILIGIGIAVIGKVPREKGYMAAGVLWLLGSLGAIWALVRAA